MHVSEYIDTPFCDGEYLVIAFNLQLEVDMEISAYLGQYGMQLGLGGCQEYHIVCVSEIVLYTKIFFDVMVEIGEIDIGQVLAQIIANG